MNDVVRLANPWEAIKDHDRGLLRQHAERLQEMGGEGWAIGQEVINFLDTGWRFFESEEVRRQKAIAVEAAEL